MSRADWATSLAGTWAPGLPAVVTLGQEVAAGGAVVVTLIGVKLCWDATHYRMSMEERAKDGLITAEQARRRIRFMAWFGPALTIVGCALLGLAVTR